MRLRTYVYVSRIIFPSRNSHTLQHHHRPSLHPHSAQKSTSGCPASSHPCSAALLLALCTSRLLRTDQGRNNQAYRATESTAYALQAATVAVLGLSPGRLRFLCRWGFVNGVAVALSCFACAGYLLAKGGCGAAVCNDLCLWSVGFIDGIMYE